MNEWIDCKVSFPPEGDESRSDDVLVAFADGTCAVMYLDYEFRLWRDTIIDEACLSKRPTHWMPLPDAPVKEIA